MADGVDRDVARRGRSVSARTASRGPPRSGGPASAPNARAISRRSVDACRSRTPARRRRRARPGPRTGRPGRGRARRRCRRAGRRRHCDRVVAGAHHVAGEQRDVGGDAVGHVAQRQVGASARAPARPGCPGSVAERRAVAEDPAVLALLVVAAQAVEARAAGGVEAAEHAVADAHARDVVAGREHRADELVADREARLDLDPAVVDVQVRAADPARLDRARSRRPRLCSSGSGRSSTADLVGRLEGDGVTLHRSPGRS